MGALKKQLWEHNKNLTQDRKHQVYHIKIKKLKPPS